ncbi:hypothetical protein Tco_1407301 [Tanacetum coccineum]
MMANLSEDIQCAGSDTAHRCSIGLILSLGNNVSVCTIWEKIMGVNILNSIDEGPFKMGKFQETLAEGALHLGPEQDRVFADLTPEEKERFKADIHAMNILLQGLPKDIYALINHYTNAKDIWDNVKMILEGFELKKDERESQLYDEFKHFRQNKGETIHENYVRFTKIINDIRNIKMTMPKMQLNSKFVNNVLPEWVRFVTVVKLNRGLKQFNYDQLYAYLKQHEAHANETKMMLERYNQHAIDPLSFVSNVSPQHYPTQSSTISQSAYVPPGRQNRGQGNYARGAIVAGNRGVQNRVGNANPGQSRQIKCYNCNGIAYIARNYTQPKRPQNSEYFKDKMLLMQAQENGVVLDEEQLLFIAANQYDAFDSDVDEASTTQTMFMENLSSADLIYDEASPSYDSNILFEVQDHDNYVDSVGEYHEYVKDNAVKVIQSNVSSVSNDALMMIINYMHEQSVQCVSGNKQNKVVNASLTAKLARYKEQVQVYEKRARITPTGLTEGEKGFEQTKECYLTEVIPFFKTLQEQFEGIQTALVKEVKEIKEIFEQMEAEVEQNVVDNVMNDGNIVSRFSKMHDAYTVEQARCLKFEVELSKLKYKIQKDDHSDQKDLECLVFWFNLPKLLEIEFEIDVQDKMAKENVPAPTPTRSDKQILPFKAWLHVGKDNLLLDLQKLQKNPIFYISVDILQNTNFFRAFTALANWFTLNADLLRKALEITPVDPAHPFVSPPAGEQVMHVNNLYQPWRAILSLINRCLIGKNSGNEKPRHLVLQMLWGIVTRTNVDYVELLCEEFVQAIQIFFAHLANLNVPTKKPTLHVIPYCRFTKLIIFYLGSEHNIHIRPRSPVHIIGDEYLLGNLKSVPKGEKDEYLEMVARKPTTKEGGQKKTASEADKPKKPTSIKKPKPAKQMKPVKEKSTKPAPSTKASKVKVLKVQKGKRFDRLVDEKDVEPQPAPKPQIEDDEYNLERGIQMSLESFQAPVGGVAIHEHTSSVTRSLLVVQGKGKGIATDERVAQSLLRTPVTKEASTGPSAQLEDDTSINIVRDTPSPPDVKTGAEAEMSDIEGDTGILNVGEEKGEDVSNIVALEERIVELDEGQAGSDPSNTIESQPPLDVDKAGSNPGQSYEALVRPNPEPMHEDFIATVYPKVHESLKHTTMEHVFLENPPSLYGTFSSMKNLDDAFTYGDQLLYDKPTEEEPDKANMETEVEYMVIVPIHQASSIAPPLSTPIIDFTQPKPVYPPIQELVFTATTATTTTTFQPPPPPQ